MNPNEQIIAYPGHALVGMKPRYGDFDGQIAIPGTARSRKIIGRLGTVCSINPYPKGRNSLIFEQGKLVSRPAYLMNKYYTTLLGKLVLCKNAKLAFGTLYKVRLEDIESTACEGIEMSDENEVARCFQCHSAGEANILLGPDGYCPVCGLNKYHEHIDSKDIKAMMSNNDKLRDHILRIPTEVEHVLKGGGALKGNVISYPGQRNRSGLVKAKLSDVVRLRLEGK